MVGVDRGFDVFDHKYSYNHDARSAQLVVDLAIRELHANRGEPTFFFVHLFDPHLSYAPPTGYDTKFTDGRTGPAPPITMAMCKEMQTGESGQEPPPAQDIDYIRGVYQGEVNFMDAQVGRFVEELKSLGLYDQATLVVTSDHGEEFWDHGGFEHGHTLYDELIHVPLIVKFPAGVEPGRHAVSEPVRVLDVMPTLEAPQGNCDDGQAEAFGQTLPLRSSRRENNVREGDRRRHCGSQRLSGQDLNPLEQAPSRDRTPRRRSREIIRGAKNPRHKGKRPGKVERVCGGNNRTG